MSPVLQKGKDFRVWSKDTMSKADELPMVTSSPDQEDPKETGNQEGHSKDILAQDICEHNVLH